jgi:hypothetical protein
VEAILGVIDWIRGRKHFSKLWQPEPGFEIHLDLERHSLCRCRIGDPIEWLSGLGPPEDFAELKEQRYCYYSYYSRGFEVGEEDGKMADFAVFWLDYLQAGFQPFNGSVTYRGKTVPLGTRTTEREFTTLFGHPYCRDQDQDEIILFYEYREDIEWQVEFTPEGGLKAMRVVWPALMAEADQRERCGVSVPWPPRRE